jgi:hypothetical protein
VNPDEGEDGEAAGDDVTALVEEIFELALDKTDEEAVLTPVEVDEREKVDNVELEVDFGV